MCALQMLLQVESLWLSHSNNWAASCDFGLVSLEIKGAHWWFFFLHVLFCFKAYGENFIFLHWGGGGGEGEGYIELKATHSFKSWSHCRQKKVVSEQLLKYCVKIKGTGNDIAVEKLVCFIPTGTNYHCSKLKYVLFCKGSLLGKHNQEAVNSLVLFLEINGAVSLVAFQVMYWNGKNNKKDCLT